MPTKETPLNCQNMYGKIPFSIKWKIIRKCNPYNNITKKCNLCLYEKFVIICRKDLCTLYKRNELATSCPHRNRYVSFKTFILVVLIEKGVLQLKVFLNRNRKKREFQQKYFIYLQNDMVTSMFFEYNINK